MSWQRWETAWQECLYGARGFYRRQEGPAGHFATSAQGVPGVGTLLARAVAALAQRHGLSQVIDVGTGRGELLRELTRLAPQLRLTGVDVVARPEDLPFSISWVTSPGGAGLPESLTALTDTLLLAHEWLDVVPCPVAEVDDHGVGRYVEVDPNGNERLGDALDAVDHQWCQKLWPLEGLEAGHRIEVGRPRDRAWEDLRGRVRRGVVVAVDYGHLAEDRPPFGTLTGYRRGQQVRPVPDGSTDVTAHVAIDGLGASTQQTQRALFGELGLLPARPEHALARSDPAAYLHALADHSAAAAASASPGLGDFWWVLAEVGQASPTISSS